MEVSLRSLHGSPCNDVVVVMPRLIRKFATHFLQVRIAQALNGMAFDIPRANSFD
jgi:hypothetical protein